MFLIKYFCILLNLFFLQNAYKHDITTRALQKSHEKPRLQKISDSFLKIDTFDREALLLNLLINISTVYFKNCATVVLYDNFTENTEKSFLEALLVSLPGSIIHGQITDKFKVTNEKIMFSNNICLNFIMFIDDIMKSTYILGTRHENIVVVTKSSQWRVFEFFSNSISQTSENLLVLVNSYSSIISKKTPSYTMYTHTLYSDALGSSIPNVITSYQSSGFTRNVNLFPRKMRKGFSGHRFIVALASQPPFVIKKDDNNNGESSYDGIEVRLVNLLAQIYNFTIEYKEASDINIYGSGHAVIRSLLKSNLNLGIGGAYITKEKTELSGNMIWHSQDCASFISLASTALPRYRAIMGPFHWTVWLSLTTVYILAIFLFSFSDKLTLKYLLETPQELENMFWYVYGTFTNCFTFSSKAAWSKAEKVTTKILVGTLNFELSIIYASHSVAFCLWLIPNPKNTFYWIFTIIITACYTGSIIAFVTIPVFPEVIDSIEQLLNKKYQIGTLDKGDWPGICTNVTDKVSRKLLEKPDYVPTIIEGLKNVTKAFFWPYAYLASREELDFIVRTNFTIGSKRSILHITSQCFIQFNVGIVLPKKCLYRDILHEGVMHIFESGLIDKMKRDVEWQVMRAGTGKLLSANSVQKSIKSLTNEDRSLSLNDVQGMFLLLGIGFSAGTISLITEVFGGCFNIFKKKRNMSVSSSIESNPRFHESQTKNTFYGYTQQSEIPKNVVEYIKEQKFEKSKL